MVHYTSVKNFGRTLDSLRKHGVARISWHPDGNPASVEFAPPEHREPNQTAAQRADEKVQYHPGTDVPLGNAPLNPLDTVLKVPRFDSMETA